MAIDVARCPRNISVGKKIKIKNRALKQHTIPGTLPFAGYLSMYMHIRKRGEGYAPNVNDCYLWWFLLFIFVSFWYPKQYFMQ